MASPFYLKLRRAVPLIKKLAEDLDDGTQKGRDNSLALKAAVDVLNVDIKAYAPSIPGELPNS